MRWAVLLRGVNVGGARKLPMADLRACLEANGFSDVRTLLASGNAAVSTIVEAPAVIESVIEDVLREHCGLLTDVLVRSKAELEAVLAREPFPEASRERPSQTLVLFHRKPFPVEKLDALPPGPERLHAHGRELVIDFQDGIGRSALPQAMARAKFPKIATGRNWNTVRKLAALL